MDLPPVALVGQEIAAPREPDPLAALDRGLAAAGVLARVEPGQKVALTAGSRGIRDLAAVLAHLGQRLRERGALPFVAPAMGSHGGATGPGQAAVLAHLGLAEAQTGLPVVSDMATVELGRTSFGLPVLMGQDFARADHVVIVNRVKPHTSFRGQVESGLNKMLAIGMGKHAGALASHQQFFRHGFEPVVREVAAIALAELKVLCGVALVENRREETARLEVVMPGRFWEAERELLALARRLMGRVPFADVDLLIVDEMGKNISGTGMDTNIIGFWRRFGGAKDPVYHTLVVRDLTPESHGNAMGIGFADLIPRALVEKIDLTATYTNGIASNTWSIVRIPITLDHDRACIETALAKHAAGSARVIRIRNTLALDTLSVSENLLPVLDGNPCIEIAGIPEDMGFDAIGNLQ